MCGRIEKHSVEIGQRLAEARAEQKKYVEKTEKQKGVDKAEKRRDALQRKGRFHQKTVSGRKPHQTAQDGRPLVSRPGRNGGDGGCVDDAGQLQMQWDNGRTLALVPGVDAFSRIDARRKKGKVR